MEPLSQRIPVIVIVAAVALPALFLILPHADPLLLFGTVACILAVLAAAFYWPAMFLVLPVFAPQLKSAPGMKSIEGHVDLTLAALCVTACVIGLHSLLGTNRVHLARGRFSAASKQITAFVFFAMIVAASYLYTSAPEYGGAKLMRFLLIGGFFLLAPLYLLNCEEDLRHFCFAFVVMGVAQSSVLLARAQRVAELEDTEVTRIGAGWVIGAAILMLLFYRLVESRFWRTGLIMLALPCLVAGLIASASRGVIISVSAALIYLLFRTYESQNKAAMAGVVGLAIACATLAYHFANGTVEQKYSDKFGEIVQLSEAHTSSASAGQPVGFYGASLHEVADHPVLGLGVGGWSQFYYGHDGRAYPHNLLLEITTEEGLLGLIAFAFFLVAIFEASHQLSRLTASHFVVLSGLLIFTLVATMFSGDLDDDRLLWLWSGTILAVLHFARVQLAHLAMRHRMDGWTRPHLKVVEPAR
jgi:O-antigen ligase